MEPLVSIGMPVYNGGRHLRGALDSLLSQDHSNLQLIISDNASTDETAEICREYAALDSRVSYSRNHTNIGAAANFNLVSELAEGRYFMFAAHDDLWKPSYISRCLEKLDEHPGAVLCSSEVALIVESGHHRPGRCFTKLDTLGLSVTERIHEVITRRRGMVAIYGLMRLEALRATNMYRGVYGGDVLLTLELALLGEFAVVPEQLFFYRIPDKGKTARDFMRDTNPKETKTAARPHTFMASELLATVQASDLDAVTKNEIRADFVRVFTYTNAPWRKAILAENAQPKNMPLREVRNLIDSLLPAPVGGSDESPPYRVTGPSKVVLVFFPHKPWPPRSGEHRRCLELISGLLALGCEVVLTSSTESSEVEWDKASVDGLIRMGVADIRLYRMNIADAAYVAVVKVIYRLAGKRPPGHRSVNTPPGMRLWFAHVARRLPADVIVMTDTYWDGLVRSYTAGGAMRVIVSSDICTVDRAMREALAAYMPGRVDDLSEVDERVLDEEFFSSLTLEADPQEFDIYDKYDYTIAIAPHEASLLAREAEGTTVALIPMTQEPPLEPRYINNAYDGPAIFTTRPNPFDVQGYLYLAKKVLPLLKEKAPGFSLKVTGIRSDSVPAVEGIELLGFVPDLEPLYEACGFAVCPVLGGTGQQIQVVEAMANGLPVIASRYASESSPIHHGENGFIAGSAAEFAEYSARLWADRALCRRLGEAARETIATENSRPKLLEGLSELLEGRSPAKHGKGRA